MGVELRCEQAATGATVRSCVPARRNPHRRFRGGARTRNPALPACALAFHASLDRAQARSRRGCPAANSEDQPALRVLLASPAGDPHTRTIHRMTSSTPGIAPSRSLASSCGDATPGNSPKARASPPLSCSEAATTTGCGAAAAIAAPLGDGSTRRSAAGPARSVAGDSDDGCRSVTSRRSAASTPPTSRLAPPRRGRATLQRKRPNPAHQRRRPPW
jgi:hypothetical protein